MRYSFPSINNCVSPQVIFSLKEVQKESEKQVTGRGFLALQIIDNKPVKYPHYCVVRIVESLYLSTNKCTYYIKFHIITLKIAPTRFDP